MDKYCPVEQIECEHVVGYFCNAINQCGYINFGHLKQCPWPERQVPVEPPPIRENFLREQYLIFERAGYERGRFDMKREIEEKVDAIPYTFVNKKNVLAAIEGVK